MIQILEFVKYVGQLKLDTAQVIVDATVGNGHDTLWLTESAKNAKIYGFDVQSIAINHAKERLESSGIDNQKVTFINDSHANIDLHVHEEIDLILFNFGYLPGGDKTITTTKQTSLIAIEKSLKMLRKAGIAILVVYPGHEEGEKEAEAIEQTVASLPWELYHVYHYCIMNNTKKPPRVYVVKKS